MKMAKSDPCSYCLHPRENHHKGCDRCFAVPSTHGLYCENHLCCCLDFSEEMLDEEDIQALMGNQA
jgi:hypothetical protein